MRIFHLEKPWDSKVNFIDEKNVVLGFDGTDDCCAHGGWYLSDKSEASIPEDFVEESMTLEGYSFDPSYFKERDFERKDAEDAQTVEFRLVKYKSPDKFLTLFNCHNGYYARGFTFTVPVDRTRDQVGNI